jgi:hypothetical protein
MQTDVVEFIRNHDFINAGCIQLFGGETTEFRLRDILVGSSSEDIILFKGAW